MDAMKHFTEGMIKENKPQFEVGDTVRVSVRIKAVSYTHLTLPTTSRV